MGGKSTYLRQAALIVIMRRWARLFRRVLCGWALWMGVFTRIGAKQQNWLGGARRSWSR